MLPDSVIKCVVFVGCQKEKSRPLIGTAFFVRETIGENWHLHYLITAKHVIESVKQRAVDGRVWIRFNARSGILGWIETRIEDWLCHPEKSSVDVAATLVMPNVIELCDCAALPIERFTTKDLFEDRVAEKASPVGIGSPIYFPGLFSQQYGDTKNIPILRVGNLATSTIQAVTTTRTGALNAYLVEARSIGGISGSPVFVDFSSGTNRENDKGPKGLYLLGIVHGHWDIGDGQSDSVTSEDMFLTQRSINMGIAIVVPADDVKEVLAHEMFEKAREISRSQIRDGRLGKDGSINMSR
jgi:hypothetical protein